MKRQKNQAQGNKGTTNSQSPETAQTAEAVLDSTKVSEMLRDASDLTASVKVGARLLDIGAVLEDAGINATDTEISEAMENAKAVTGESEDEVSEDLASLPAHDDVLESQTYPDPVEEAKKAAAAILEAAKLEVAKMLEEARKATAKPSVDVLKPVTKATDETRIVNGEARNYHHYDYPIGIAGNEKLEKKFRRQWRAAHPEYGYASKGKGSQPASTTNAEVKKDAADAAKIVKDAGI